MTDPNRTGSPNPYRQVEALERIADALEQLVKLRVGPTVGEVLQSLHQGSS